MITQSTQLEATLRLTGKVKTFIHSTKLENLTEREQSIAINEVLALDVMNSLWELKPFTEQSRLHVQDISGIAMYNQKVEDDLNSKIATAQWNATVTLR